MAQTITMTKRSKKTTQRKKGTTVFRVLDCVVYFCNTIHQNYDSPICVSSQLTLQVTIQ